MISLIGGLAGVIMGGLRAKLNKNRQNNTSKKKNPIKELIIGLGFLVFLIGLTIFYNQYKEEKVLQEAAEMLSQQTLLMGDEITRLDSCAYYPKRNFCYYYTLIENFDESEYTELKEFIINRAIDNMKGNPDMDGFRKMKVTLKYYYRNESGEKMFDIAITPDLYKD